MLIFYLVREELTLLNVIILKIYFFCICYKCEEKREKQKRSVNIGETNSPQKSIFLRDTICELKEPIVYDVIDLLYC